MPQWTPITTPDAIPLREGRCVTFGSREIALFHLPGRFVAIDNRCPHNQGPLCDGMVAGATVVCPLHGWKISLDTGEVKKPDVPVGVRTYPVRVENGLIEIDLAPKIRSEQEVAA